MPSLKDVAAACGLSVTQVSRALNGKNDVSEATKQRVRQTAARIGYVKNMNAWMLSAGVNAPLAVIVCGLDHKNDDSSFVMQTIQGIYTYAGEAGRQVVVHFVDKSPQSYEDYCRQHGLNGVIMLNMDYDDPAFQSLTGGTFPCVAIDVPIEGENKGCVIVNNTYYATRAVSHLIERGRRTLAMMCGNRHSMVEIERRSGYELALTRAGLAPDEDLLVYGNFDYETARLQTQQLMQRRPDVDAFFCASDLMALGVINALRQLHFKVPKQVAVFGFDGVPLGEYARPALSTIRQDNRKKGYQAARLLCSILAGEPTDTTTLVVPCEVCVRASS